MRDERATYSRHADQRQGRRLRQIMIMYCAAGMKCSGRLGASETIDCLGLTVVD